MATAMEPQARANDRQWFIVSRWQEYEGEGRANLLRIIGVTVFYAVQLYYYHLQLNDQARADYRPFHLAITMLTLAWMMVGLGVLLCRKNYFFPGSLKFISTACDLVLLTAMIGLANGPKSPLVVIYFLIITLACLRFHLPLIWFATGGALAGYVFLAGHAYWFAEAKRVTPNQHLIIVLALVLTGVILGQVIRRVRSLAINYSQRLGQQNGNKP